jgi:hypothetical protein
VRFAQHHRHELAPPLLTRWHTPAQCPAARFGLLTQATVDQRPREVQQIGVQKDIQHIVGGGEANGYWQMMGAKNRAKVSIDEWRRVIRGSLRPGL